MFRRNTKSGFTLVEILIVVIILGILAAIVIPQFTNASQDARKSSLVSQLQTLRSQIQLFKLQHGEVLPTLVAGWADLNSVTQYPVGSANNFGPYMQADPKNPLNGLSNVLDAGVGQITMPATASAACGFIYNYDGGVGTGRIWGTDGTGATPGVNAFFEP
jgi:general secretion pathway protein G